MHAALSHRPREHHVYNVVEGVVVEHSGPVLDVTQEDTCWADSGVFYVCKSALDFIRSKRVVGEHVSGASHRCTRLRSGDAFGRKEWKGRLVVLSVLLRTGDAHRRCTQDGPPATLSSDSQPLSSTRVHHQPLAYHGGQQQHDTSNKQLLATTSRY